MLAVLWVLGTCVVVGAVIVRHLREQRRSAMWESIVEDWE